MRTPPFLLVWSLAGCGALSPSRDTGGHSVDDPGLAPTGSAFAPENPAWSPEEASAALTTALETGFPEFSAIAAVYVAALALRDTACPTFRLSGEPPAEGLGPWFAEACTTAAGITFDGEATDLAVII